MGGCRREDGGKDGDREDPRDGAEMEIHKERSWLTQTRDRQRRKRDGDHQRQAEAEREGGQRWAGTEEKEGMASRENRQGEGERTAGSRQRDGETQRFGETERGRPAREVGERGAQVELQGGARGCTQVEGHVLGRTADISRETETEKGKNSWSCWPQTHVSFPSPLSPPIQGEGKSMSPPVSRLHIYPQPRVI